MSTTADSPVSLPDTVRMSDLSGESDVSPARVRTLRSGARKASDSDSSDEVGEGDSDSYDNIILLNLSAEY